MAKGSVQTLADAYRISKRTLRRAGSQTNDRLRLNQADLFFEPVSANSDLRRVRFVKGAQAALPFDPVYPLFFLILVFKKTKITRSTIETQRIKCHL